MGILGKIPEASESSINPKTAAWGLVSCFFLYVGFRWIRPALPQTLALLRDSFPSFLLGVAMTISLGLFPSIRFKTYRSQALVTLTAISLAGIWFEAVVPCLVDQTNFCSTGTLADFAAMLLGSAIVLLSLRKLLDISPAIG